MNTAAGFVLGLMLAMLINTIAWWNPGPSMIALCEKTVQEHKGN